MDKVAFAPYVAAMAVTETIDARGLLCPLPVLKLRKRLRPLRVGDEVALWADDPAAVVDVPHFCAESGHEMVSISEAETHQIYVVRKSG